MCIRDRFMKRHFFILSHLGFCFERFFVLPVSVGFNILSFGSPNAMSPCCNEDVYTAMFVLPIEDADTIDRSNFRIVAVMWSLIAGFAARICPVP